jgi:hypothetical protein
MTKRRGLRRRLAARASRRRGATWLFAALGSVSLIDAQDNHRDGIAGATAALPAARRTLRR